MQDAKAEGYLSLVPPSLANLSAGELTAAQMFYLQQVFQAGLRLMSSILEVQSRLNFLSEQLSDPDPETCYCLINLIQLAESEYELLCACWSRMAQRVDAIAQV